MIDYKKAESIFVKHECTDFRWIDPREIVTSQWVRTKCLYGCGNFRVFLHRIGTNMAQIFLEVK